MDLTGLPILDRMRDRMEYLSQRQGVVASNVANANTPGYRALDLAKPEFERQLKGELGLRTTNARHLNAGGAPGAAAKLKDTPDSEETPNGNTVVLEDQMLKAAEIQADYATVSTLYRRALNLIRTAAGAGR
jgi:flagellar basal-body rod protein FlgB